MCGTEADQIWFGEQQQLCFYLEFCGCGTFWVDFTKKQKFNYKCGPMPNVMATLPNIGGALCSTPHSLADAQYWNAVQ